MASQLVILGAFGGTVVVLGSFEEGRRLLTTYVGRFWEIFVANFHSTKPTSKLNLRGSDLGSWGCTQRISVKMHHKNPRPWWNFKYLTNIFGIFIPQICGRPSPILTVRIFFKWLVATTNYSSHHLFSPWSEQPFGRGPTTRSLLRDLLTMGFFSPLKPTAEVYISFKYKLSIGRDLPGCVWILHPVAIPQRSQGHVWHEAIRSRPDFQSVGYGCPDLRSAAFEPHSPVPLRDATERDYQQWERVFERFAWSSCWVNWCEERGRFREWKDWQDETDRRRRLDAAAVESPHCPTSSKGEGKGDVYWIGFLPNWEWRSLLKKQHPFFSGWNMLLGPVLSWPNSQIYFENVRCWIYSKDPTDQQVAWCIARLWYLWFSALGMWSWS